MSITPRLYWLLALVATAMLAAPIWIFAEIPILDHPAHLARVTLLSTLPLDPLLARHWMAGLHLVPNLAMDLFVPAVAPLIGPEAGLKLFMTLGLGLWIAGAGLLFRGFWGRWDAQALLAAPFAVNASFDLGFFNFHVGTGLALVGAGLWLIRPSRGLGFLAAMAGLAVVILYSHLMALAILALLIGGIEIGRLLTRGAVTAETGRALRDGLVVFLPVALLHLLVDERGEGGAVAFDLLRNLASPFLYSSSIGGVARNPLPALLLLALFGFAGWNGRLRVAPGGLVLLGLVALATLLMPTRAFGGAGIHMRMAAVLLVVALAVLRIDALPLAAAGRSRVLAVGMAIVGLAGLAPLLTLRDAAAAAAELRALDAAGVPEGGRLATAFVADPARNVRLWHVGDLAAVDRHAFVPTFFTTPGQSTVRVTPAYRRIAAVDAFEGGALSLADVKALLDRGWDDLDATERLRLRPYRTIACDFDRLLLIGRPAETDVPAELVPIEIGRHGGLYAFTPKPERACPPR